MHAPSRLAPFAALAGLLLATACSEAPAPAERVADPDSRRSLPAGDVVGFAAEYGSHAWLALPYAAPPVGELRWKGPRVAPPWEGTFEALEDGAPCVQLSTPLAGVGDAEPGTPVGQEDCLTLDVYAPRFAPGEVPRGDARLPVMVWIHGGGNRTGLSSFYHGGNLASSEDVIVVAIQYRLGPFGWLRHAALRGEGTTAADRSGNFGTLDQIRALEWVQANVEAFGGDPDRVTIFGESAGGRDVFALLGSREAEGLFHRAISQSGGTTTTAPDRAENWADDPLPGDPYGSNEMLARLLVADGTAADREAARAWLATRDDPEIAEYLRGVEAYAVIAAVTDPESGRTASPQMFADGYVLPRQDLVGRFERGAYNRVPVVLGTNRDEQKLFLALNPDYAERRWGLVPEPHDPDRFYALAEHLSNAWKATGADQPAMTLHGQQPGRVWVYRFDWDEELSIPWVRLDRVLGASHGFEIPFVFGHFDLGPEDTGLFTPFNRAARKDLSAAMMSYWAEFAYAGDPGRGRDGSLPAWEPWSEGAEAHKYVVLDTEDGGGIRMGSEPVTMETVVADVLADPRLRDARERCHVLREVADWGWSRGFGPDDYAEIPECSIFPFDAFPWPMDAPEGGEEAIL
jgi:para-nitrobenzyl esterase